QRTTEQRTVHPGQLNDRVLGCGRLDSSVDGDPIRDHVGDDSTSELACPGVGLGVGQLPFEYRGRGPLPEVRFEHGRKRNTPPRRGRRNRTPGRRGARGRARGWARAAGGTTREGAGGPGNGAGAGRSAGGGGEPAKEPPSRGRGAALAGRPAPPAVHAPWPRV